MGGFKVIAVEARDSGLEFCRKAGAHATMDARVPFDRFTSEAQELTALKLGFDRCIVFSDHDSALPLAMASTRPHGLVVQVGQPSKDLHFYFKHLVLRDVRLIGTMLGNRSELRELLQFVSDKRIPVAVTPSHGVETLNEVLSVARGGDFLGKLVVVVDAEAEEDDKYHGRK
jgi:propanol-preferring alcohol dehydrogenase